MNFLAHAYLSFGNPDILVGNMIADLVKGKQIESYPENIQKGIHIHRQIDDFTDKHPITHQTSEVFRTSAGKYAGAFLDVAYDHFLALDEQNTPEGGWHSFSEQSYQQIEQYADILPSKFCTLFMYMRNEDWFYNYRYKWMIERSFDRLKSRASYLDDDAPVFQGFENHYENIKKGYIRFFPELKNFVQGISL
ncbi:acyl carrier protein phosphodiesterase [Dysgonomonas hofstadii]|uniref:Acyl carrier protein phosphodiesterase n=1 Tax=Dysgonomonas hofstadii TaxID=637886 RepID=A0A840CWA0_9BACT|nr:ACP phosphodiesterase [Dysgonomonas hofstadii]MBB4036103.1 acyl carrier protein phosphodiesterase [Dysgonomonas hofstadii]